jgi:predicted phage terminase large subunit-like protein
LERLKASPVGLARIAAADSGLAWDYPAHLKALNLALLDIARGDNRFLLVFMPPGHAKSSVISEAFPAWLLGTQPHAQVILSTYGQEFSETWGRKARDLLLAYGPVLYGVQVRQDSKSVSEWRIANRRGVMYSVGVGGQTTGKRADFALIDDPVKNADEAESEVMRENLYRWFQQTLYTRLTPQGAIVLCMTRWHHDDLAGRLLADRDAGRGLPWRVLNFPALAEAGDALDRPAGGPLWPKLYGSERLAEIQATLSERAWLAMYQQRPTPEHGATYHRDWFEHRYEALPPLDRRILTVDSAFKLGIGSDFTSCQVWGVNATGYYLLHVTNERLEYPELTTRIRELADEHKVAGVYIEDKASGQSAVQTLQRETRLAVFAVPVTMSKQARADGNAPTWRAGRVFLPASAPWVGDFIQQHVLFPRAAHDDMVDAGNIALDTLKYGSVGVQRFNY